jgi:hypothetical protein
MVDAGTSLCKIILIYFGIHSKRTEISIEYAPDVINDHFATIVNDGNDLDNSDIPTDTQREGESAAFTDSSQF